ncbi:MAG: leucine-rich repeat domain-containing protein, partial [Planctomycetaceae bacterium]|nr:leucine-rich repeat domain-containing protein [Planctomycetaceae bacterium]
MRFLEVAFKHFTPEDIFMKKHKHLLLAFLLPALFLCGCKPAAETKPETAAIQQQEETASAPSPTIDEELQKQLDEEFVYELTADGSVTITQYTGYASSVTIPHGVTSIGNEAFGGCDSLTSVTIPNSVTSIGVRAFAGCGKLTEIQVSAGNTHFKSVDGILFSADGKTLIQVPAGKGLTEYTIPDGVTSIGNKAFSRCWRLTSVTIPDSVTSIGKDAFSHCWSLTSVTIGDSVTSIGGDPFAECDQLTEIRVSAGNTHFKSEDGILFTADGKTLIQFPKGKYLTE